MNVKDDSLSRKLYAQDASMYQQLPSGIAFPTSKDDIIQLVRQANLDGFSLIARGAGTSLAGQTVGDGVIVDSSRFMTEILELQEEEQWVDVEPGVILETLNMEATAHKLLFAPDTDTLNSGTIGGMIGNNSSGMYSIKYKTTREHILEMDVVLSDGSTATFKPLTEDELEEKLQYETLEGDIYRGMLKLLQEHKDLIQENYPHQSIIRRNTGYALDKLCEMAPIEPKGRSFNLCELLCGSEGTLALTTRARLNLEHAPSEKIVLVPHFNSLNDAMLATMEAVRMKPTAVELVDEAILDATKGNQIYHLHRFFISGEPKYVLIIQFDGDNAEILQKKIERLKDRLREKKLCYSYPIIKTKEDIEKVWELRHAGIVHLYRKGAFYSPTFYEDTAVRVNDLPSYTREVKEIFANYKLESIIYGNASVGTLHFRPVIDTTNDEGLEILKKTASEMADLVRAYKGSLTGTHGDGRVRSPFIKQAMGEELVEVLKEVKYLWDKFGVFNPGKIVDPEPVEKDLRFSANYEPYDFNTEFAWRNEGGIRGMIDGCNGVGVCRKLAQSGGTMCPSYMATKDEKDSPRGRANIFRQVFEGEDPEAFNSSDLKEALEFCLSCKACKSECPSNVDMAKLKAEFEYGWQQKNRLSDEHVYFSRAYKAYKYAIKYPRLSNYIVSKELGKSILNVFFGISKARTLPALSLKPFNVKEYEFPKTPQKKVALIVDMFTQYHHPQIADAAVKVFNFLGYEVLIPHLFDTGRIAISKGRLDIAKENAQHMLTTLQPLVDQKIPIVGLEPSELLTLRDEFLDLVDEEALEKATEISKYSFLFEEFLIRHPVPTQIRNGGKVLVHQHCHSKVLSPKNTLQHMLERWGFDVVMLDAGCCGMAGSFGYEHDKYELSMQIGEERLFPSIKLNLKNNICAPGFSCRHQIFDGTNKHALHPAELIAQQVINM